MKKTSLHVAIIGAGLGGLCLAHGLKKHGISFSIFERDDSPTSRPQGYRIRIDHTGQSALQHCLSTSAYTAFVSSCALPSTHVQTLTPQLKLIDRWVEAWTANDFDSPDLKADRTAMRQVLLEEVQDRVYFGKKWMHCEVVSTKLIRSYFEDGSTCDATLLVAADGAMSPIREKYMPHIQVQPTVNQCIYGKTLFDQITTLPAHFYTDTQIIFGNGLSAIIEAMSFEDRSSREPYIYWAIIGHEQYFGVTKQVHESRTIDVDQILANATAGWHADLVALFRAADSASVVMTSVKTSTPALLDTLPNLTALGDAVHVMSPAAGLGANTALHDARLLSDCLSRVQAGEKELSEALGWYEKAMICHSMAAVAASQKGGQTLSNPTDNRE
ncbi:hypothetical protein BWI96_10195 [Siphonobacter sp. SORGH_AS_0500]|uniref:FAD-dependent oxidoreductase n=1 Tax=Siphonobacter sp. SORGH_AS_0500 TaxID=1864824 RepID=UPI000CBBC776|nr:FAD-dependent monooxygenase [Siphonobacter sp. SORGH_AS_0500]PKK36739.1 hypothetical protein BWI96_10195 [Siphonobacter sp. SORGH_AS_0500]